MLNAWKKAAFCLAASFVLSSTAAWAGQKDRQVYIVWNFSKTPPSQLEVWIDCAVTISGKVPVCEDASKKITAPGSYSYLAEAHDHVTLVVIADEGGDALGDPAYTITGTNFDTKDLDGFKKFLGVASATAAAVHDAARAVAPPGQKSALKVITDPLIAGCKLAVTFTLKTTEAGRDTVTQTSGVLIFLIRQAPPRLTVSYGVAFSNAKSPTVGLIKTSTLLTFQKDGQTQQAYQQAISVTGTGAGAKPIQSLLTMANARVIGSLYTTIGVQANGKVFESPILGGTYRIGSGGSFGVNVTAAVMFSHETEIDPGSGFYAGQVIDPTAGLTVADIPTRQVYHRRYVLALGFDF